uniref:serine O-acetyltransferase n=1 Tax=Araucaria cunninghamii TaxID=56994 RepID=A0A0D6R2W1_ARACU
MPSVCLLRKMGTFGLSFQLRTDGSSTSALFKSTSNPRRTCFFKTPTKSDTHLGLIRKTRSSIGCFFNPQKGDTHLGMRWKNRSSIGFHGGKEKEKFCRPMRKGLVSMAMVLQTSDRNKKDCVAGSDELWVEIRREATRDAEAEPTLASYLYSTILAHRSLEKALACHLGNKLSNSTLLNSQLYNLIADSFMEDAHIRECIRADIRAFRERDAACVSFSHCLLNFKGFLACQAHRVAHRLWNQGRVSLALAIQSRVSEVFSVDIHPAARIGKGVFFDHATGVVVGETATIGSNVSILHHVTLGGTGKCGGDRHPKIGDGVLIGAGATILGNIRIGEGAKIGAGSVVLIEVPSYTTAVGNPARLVGGKKSPAVLKEIPSKTMDHTSFISEWSDYVI